MINNNRTHIAIMIIRVSVGLMMLSHGIAKIKNGVAGIGSAFANVGLPEFLGYTVYIGEVLAPVMLILGLRTRIAGALLAFTMVVAVALAHVEDITFISDYGAWGIETQGFYFFTGLALALSGGGRYSISKTNKWD